MFMVDDLKVDLHCMDVVYAEMSTFAIRRCFFVYI